jgi:hypothetical protein
MNEQTHMVSLTPKELLMSVRAFVVIELEHRKCMADRQPKNLEYWQQRVAQAQTTLEHIDRLKMEVFREP